MRKRDIKQKEKEFQKREISVLPSFGLSDIIKKIVCRTQPSHKAKPNQAIQKELEKEQEKNKNTNESIIQEKFCSALNDKENEQLLYFFNVLIIGRHHFIDPEFRFVDTDFPPLKRSLSDSFFGEEQFPPEITWQRAADFMLEGIHVFKDELISPNDILEGQLGNCWFLSALACLAEIPSYIQRLFLTKTYNEQGIYSINMCKNGEWQAPVLDDFFPCINGKGAVFSENHDNELWVLLLEKAYSKLHGSYESISGGEPQEAMMDLTGCPTFVLNFVDKKVKKMIKTDKLWHLLLHSIKRGYIASAGTPGTDVWSGDDDDDDTNEQDNEQDDLEDPKYKGIVPGHAYSIISADEFKGTRLVCMRNPWGEFEWKGDWCDRSKNWSPEFTHYFNPIFDQNDGTFWIDYEDLLDKFDSFFICMTTVPWMEMRNRNEFVNFDHPHMCSDQPVAKNLYQVEVKTQKTELIFGMHQDDLRIQGNYEEEYKKLGIVVMRKNEEKGFFYCFKNFEFAEERDRQVKLILEPGIYVIVPKMQSELSQTKIASEKSPLLDEENQPTKRFIFIVKKIFERYESLLSDAMTFREFVVFATDVEEGPPKMTILEENWIYEEFAFVVENKVSKSIIADNPLEPTKVITLKMFTEWWLEQININGEKCIYEWLEKLGFGINLCPLSNEYEMINISMHYNQQQSESRDDISINVIDAFHNETLNIFSEVLLEYYKQENVFISSEEHLWEEDDIDTGTVIAKEDNDRLERLVLILKEKKLKEENRPRRLGKVKR